MKIIKADKIEKDIEVLLERREYPAITIYLDTHKRWQKNEKSKIMLKNMLQDIEEELENRGMRDSEIEKLLSPIEDMEKDLEFWKNTTKGLAIFLSKDVQLTILLSRPISSKFYIDHYFNIKYLAEYLFEHDDYYVLALSTKKNFLYMASNKDFELIPESEFLPEDMETSMRTEGQEKSIQHATTKSIGRSSSGGTAFHGHDAYEDGEEILLQRYLNKVDKAIDRLLSKYRVPMVLVCTEPIYSLYKEINSYPGLIKDYVKGNPDEKENREALLEKTGMIVKKITESQKEKTASEYNNDTENNLSGISETIRAAYYGSVSTLLIAKMDYCWGKFNLSNGTVRLHDSFRSDSQDLLNIAVIFTIRNNGKVYNVSKKSLATEENVAAILRY